MSASADYASALVLAVPPSDRALAGWGGWPAEWGASVLRAEAWRQDCRDQARRERDAETTPRRSKTP